MSDLAVVELLVVAALLTLMVDRALFSILRRMRLEAMFPRERWAKTFRSFIQLILEDLAQSFGHPPSSLAGLMFRNTRQSEKSCLSLSERVAEAFRMEVRA